MRGNAKKVAVSSKADRLLHVVAVDPGYTPIALCGVRPARVVATPVPTEYEPPPDGWCEGCVRIANGQGNRIYHRGHDIEGREPVAAIECRVQRDPSGGRR